MSRLFLALVLSFLTALPATAANSGWVTVNSERQLELYIFREADWTSTNYPTEVRCRARQGQLQAKFTYVSATRETKPYHNWNATLLRDGETQAQAAARLPVSDHPDVKYRIKFGCKAAGKTLLVAFRGTRALD